MMLDSSVIGGHCKAGEVVTACFVKDIVFDGTVM